MAIASLKWTILIGPFSASNRFQPVCEIRFFSPYDLEELGLDLLGDWASGTIPDLLFINLFYWGNFSGSPSKEKLIGKKELTAAQI
jgi:hypothetical protein